MPFIRTTMTPTVEQMVTDAVADDLRFQGVLLEDTRATTDKGLTEAAVRQVQQRNLDPVTAEGVAEVERREAAARKRKASRAAAPRRSRAKGKAREAQAEVEVTYPDGRTETATGVLPADAATAPPTDTSGDAPAGNIDTQES